jgi:hypothetical protein
MKYCFLLLFCTLSILTINAQSLSFDGQDEYLSVPHNDAYNIGNGFTIEAWIFAEEWRDAIYQGSIVAKDNQSPDRGFAFRCGDNGSLSFVMAADNTWNEVFTGPVMNANQWHHVAVVIDAGTMTLYIDAQEIASNSFSGSPSPSVDMPINIGASPGFGGRNFFGNLDEIRIWNDARTQTELADNITTNLTGSEANLVAYFPMNEGTGTVTSDTSPTGASAGFNSMDASNWVDGYSLPDFDISVQDVYGVDVINMIDRPVKLTVDIQNTGTEAISNIDLTVKVNGEFYVTETVSNTITSNELFAYEFALPVDLVGLTDPVIEVEAAQASDGNSLNNLGVLNVKTGTTNKIIVSDNVLHKNGEQSNAIKMNMPNDLYKYEQVLLNIDLTCPAGGCGDWDVLADLKVVTSTGTYELARYITPYGIACGGWTVDITDFKSVLGGEVEFQTNVLVYTETGWLVNMTIDLIDNNTQNTFQNLSRLWEKGYQVYGDPGISYDLDPVTINFENNTDASHVRMAITGHGQGNTSNAAEFFEVDHTLNIDGSAFDNHHLWKSDCSSNPCSDQAGTWPNPRAGWCPGQEVAPYVINTNSATTAGSSISLDYVLQNYTNVLNTGYNNSGHTEPYYKIFSYFVEESSTPYETYRNLVADNVVGNLVGNTIDMATVTISNNGFEDLTNYTINIFSNSELVATENFDEMIAVGSTVDKVISLSEMVDVAASNTMFAEVVQSMDDNAGDNVAKTQITTSNNNLAALEYEFNISPNPTPDGQLFLKYDNFWKGSTVKVFTTSGILVKEFKITDNTTSFQLPDTGVFWYNLSHAKEDLNVSGKIVYLK